MFNTKQCIDELIGLIEAVIDTYLPEGIPTPTAVTFGVVPKVGVGASPCIFLYPVSVQPSQTEQSIWESLITLDISVAITEEPASAADVQAVSEYYGSGGMITFPVAVR